MIWHNVSLSKKLHYNARQHCTDFCHECNYKHSLLLSTRRNQVSRRSVYTTTHFWYSHHFSVPYLQLKRKLKHYLLTWHLSGGKKFPTIIYIICVPQPACKWMMQEKSGNKVVSYLHGVKTWRAFSPGHLPPVLSASREVTCWLIAGGSMQKLNIAQS